MIKLKIIYWKIKKLKIIYWKIKNYFVKSISALPISLPRRILHGDYPKNTRYLDNKKDTFKKIIVVEVPPGKRIVFVEGGYRKPICLYFPYTYFIVEYVESLNPSGKNYTSTKLNVGFSSKQILSTDGIINPLPLRNYIDPYTFCLGANFYFTTNKSLRESVYNCINLFWNSSFEMKPSEYFEWQFATKYGNGFNFIEKSIEKSIQDWGSPVCINHFTRSSQDFFDYQSKFKKIIIPKRKKKNRNRNKWKARKRRV